MFDKERPFHHAAKMITLPVLYNFFLILKLRGLCHRNLIVV